MKHLFRTVRSLLVLAFLSCMLSCGNEDIRGNYEDVGLEKTIEYYLEQALEDYELLNRYDDDFIEVFVGKEGEHGQDRSVQLFFKSDDFRFDVSMSFIKTEEGYRVGFNNLSEEFSWRATSEEEFQVEVIRIGGEAVYIGTD